MFLSVLGDAVRNADLTVTALVDEQRPLDLPAGVVARTVPVGGELDLLVAEAVIADATIIVAPETDGLLADRVSRARRAGARVLAPDERFIALAADKQATVDALAAAGVPVPAGRSLELRQPWPVGFIAPAVRKARVGAGCEDLLVVAGGDRPPAAATRPTRIEALAEGLPVGVSCLCGPNGVTPLPAMAQRFTTGSTPRFVGCQPLADSGRHRRAAQLARRSVAALVRAAVAAGMESGRPVAGWVGVDMILGFRDDGLGDRVLEINPRLTTSFVGHAASSSGSLVRNMIEIAAGRDPFHGRADGDPPVAFSVCDDTTAEPPPARV